MDDKERIMYLERQKAEARHIIRRLLAQLKCVEGILKQETKTTWQDWPLYLERDIIESAEDFSSGYGLGQGIHFKDEAEWRAWKKG